MIQFLSRLIMAWAALTNDNLTLRIFRPTLTEEQNKAVDMIVSGQAHTRRYKKQPDPLFDKPEKVKTVSAGVWK